MSNCAPGWGQGPWAGFPWGSIPPTIPGGPLPVAPPFDIYCVGPCGPMSVIQTHPEVSTTPGGDFTVDVPSSDLVITSNDGSKAVLYINTNITPNFTLEFIYAGTALPLNFSDVVNNHMFVGVVDIGGAAAGLFLSQAGIAYAGTSTSAKQILPGSQSYVGGNDYWVVRIAVSSSTGAVFIYITKLIDLIAGQGAVLRYVLPVVPYSSCPQDSASGTYVKVAGTLANPSQMYLDAICLASSVLIPNVPPVADPGTDQAVPTCEIIRLDGSASFDPEQVPLTYKWRLIDAPDGSMYAHAGADGRTLPLLVPTGFTDKFYSTAFGTIAVSPGDVLVVGGEVYDIIAVGSDINGDYVQISDFLLPDNLVAALYKVLFQGSLSGATTVKPTFYPDIAGFYKFDLIVFDGELFSSPETVVVNVVQSVLPRGVIPDLSFMWNYLSDFWNLVEDKERVEVVWGSIAQIAATELYSLWQTEYSKSLRDIQRTFIRRWLHYDLLLREPFVDLTTIRTVYRGIDSISILNTGGSYSGQRLDITIPFNDAGASVTLTGSNPLTPSAVALQIQAGLAAADPRFVVTVVPVDGTHSLIRIYAPFGFTVAATSTTSLYVSGAVNTALQGAGGLLTNQNTYKVDISLLGIDVKENDVLVVEITDPNGNYKLATRINSVIDSSSDTLRYQRISLKDPLPLSASSNWSIPAYVVSTQLDFFGGLVEDGDMGIFEVFDNQTQETAYYRSTVAAAIEAVPNLVLLDPMAVADFYAAPTRFTVLFWGVYRRNYLPIESLIIDVPVLQRIIKNPSEDEVLHRNLDYFLETFRGQQCLRFDPDIWISDTPLPRLWAEYTYLDNRPTIEGNFGIPVEFTLDDLSQLPSSVDYLSAVQGIWYAFLNGPTMFNLRAGTQILLGLPFAESAGTIIEIRTDFSLTQGRILVQDIAEPFLVRSYHYPSVLSLEVNPTTGVPYKVGDTVQSFAPLVKGAEIVDYVKDPTWFQGWMNQGSFYEIEKFHRFIVRVDSAAFTLPSLLFVQRFIRRIKPTYTFPTFIVEARVEDAEVDVTDLIERLGYLDLNDGALYCSPGTVTAWDIPDASPGFVSPAGGPVVAFTGELSSHVRQAYDTSTVDMVTQTFPTSPNPDGIVEWGFDRPLTGDHGMYAVASEVWAGGIPAFDGVFRYDLPVLDDPGIVFSRKHLPGVPSGGVEIEDPVTITAPATYNVLTFTYVGDPGATGAAFRLQIFKNAVLTIDVAFTLTEPGGVLAWAPFLPDVIAAVTVAASDVITAFLVPDGGGNRRPYFREIVVALCHGDVVMAFDTVLPAGAYVAHKAL